MPWMWPRDDDGRRLKRYQYWQPRVGSIIAKHQANWEYGQAVLQAHATGITFTALAQIMRMSRERVRQIAEIAKRRGGTSPVQTYLAQPFFYHVGEGVILRPDERSNEPRLPRERRLSPTRRERIAFKPGKIEPAKAWAMLIRHSKIDPSSVRPSRRSCIVAWLWANGVSSLSAETDLALQQLWQDTSLSHKDAPELVEVEVTLCPLNGSRQTSGSRPRPNRGRQRQQSGSKPSLRRRNA